MIQWVRPSGTIVETNDRPSTIEAAKALGWVQKSELDKMADTEAKPKKRGRKPKDGDSSESN